MRDDIVSKFNFWRSTWITSFLFLVALPSLAAVSLLYEQSLVMGGPPKFLFIGAYLIFVSVIPYLYAWAFPDVRIDRLGIWFGGWFTRPGFAWEEVKNIRLLANTRFMFQLVDSTVFELKNGKKYVAYIEFYRNGAALRQVIDQAQNALLTGSPIGSSLHFEPTFRDIDCEVTDSAAAENFAGNHLLSGSGIFFYGLNLAAVGSLFHMEDPIALLLGLHLVSWLSGYPLYYFQTTGQHLIVRHHLLFWRKKAFPLNAIREHMTYKYSKSADALKIILNDFRSYDFPAASLWPKDWDALKTTLAKAHIPVRR